MEDPKLVEYFRKIVGKVRSQGYKDMTIRASMHEAGPKAVWHERAYLGLVDSASVSFGIMAIVLILFGSTFVSFPAVYFLAFLLLFSGASMYFFAIGAFKFHAGEKLVMTAVLSAILSVVATLFNNILVRVFDPAIEAARAKIAELPPVDMIAMVGGDSAAKAVEQGHSVIGLFSGSRIELGAIIFLVILAYNLLPFIMLMIELAHSNKIVEDIKIEKKEEKEE